jgi:hypothetical protein
VFRSISHGCRLYQAAVAPRSPCLSQYSSDSLSNQSKVERDIQEIDTTNLTTQHGFQLLGIDSEEVLDIHKARAGIRTKEDRRLGTKSSEPIPSHGSQTRQHLLLTS